MNWDEKFELARKYLSIKLPHIDLKNATIQNEHATFFLNDKGDVRGSFIWKDYDEMQTELDELKSKNEASSKI